MEEEYEAKRQSEIETLQEAVEDKESQISQLNQQVHCCSRQFDITVNHIQIQSVSY